MIDIPFVFTDYDDSVTGEAGRDPLGFQVIWSYFGQEIFGNHITSISNDLRNFTISLFHHWVVKSLVENNTIGIENTPFTETFESENTPFFKTSVLVFLENLLIYTVLKMNSESFASTGLLGFSNASRKWETQDENPLLLLHPSAGILSRQISLGINGRYKTPLAKCNLFDNNYNYLINDTSGNWNKVEEIFSNWKEAAALKKGLEECLHKILAKKIAYKEQLPLASIKKAYPETGIQTEEDLKKIPIADLNTVLDNFSDLPKHYTSVFGKPEKWAPKVTGLWKDLLGLRSGAAGNLYTAIVKGKEDFKAILDKAHTEETDEKEKSKISHILTVEPLLSMVDYLFRLANSREVKTVTDIEKELEKRTVDLKQIVDHLELVELRDIVNGISNSIAKVRFQKLLEIPAYTHETSKLIQSLAEYHTLIMDFRGLFPWFSISKEGAIQHNAKMYSLSMLDKRKPSDWLHSYYLDVLISLENDLEFNK